MKARYILKYLIFLLLMVSIGILYSFSNARNKRMNINEIHVRFQSKEHPFLSKNMVNKLLIQNDSSVQNQAKSVIDLYRLEEQVLKNPYIEKASLYIGIEGTLNALIKQRTPIARVITSDKTYYFDSKGVRIPLSERYSARVPLITGIERGEDVKKVIVLLQKMTTDDFLKREIIGIHFNNSKECLFTVRSGNYKIAFGALKEMDQKFRKLKVFYNKAFSDSTIQQYKTINIKYHNQVVGEK